MNQLEFLKQVTTVVVDTGEFHQLQQFQPQDATTNPSLILKAVQNPQYSGLLTGVLKSYGTRNLNDTMDQLLVRFGCEILQYIPGRVSTEVDARLSFDTVGTITRAERIIDLYQGQGVHIDRVLIKVAATWEGIEAASRLEQRGIHTNLTLVFSLVQAIACANARVQLISPFVGRVYDWHKKQAGDAWNEATYSTANDPGVQLVRQIYHYVKQHNIQTEVMGASFRNTEQIMALAGCDLLTISPDLLAQLAATPFTATAAPLQASAAKENFIPVVEYDEPDFRYALNADVMATDKLAEGIRLFAADTNKLEQMMLAHA